MSNEPKRDFTEEIHRKDAIKQAMAHLACVEETIFEELEEWYEKISDIRTKGTAYMSLPTVVELLAQMSKRKALIHVIVGNGGTL